MSVKWRCQRTETCTKTFLRRAKQTQNGRKVRPCKTASDCLTLTMTPDASRLDTSACATNCQQTSRLLRGHTLLASPPELDIFFRTRCLVPSCECGSRFCRRWQVTNLLCRLHLEPKPKSGAKIGTTWEITTGLTYSVPNLKHVKRMFFRGYITEYQVTIRKFSGHLVPEHERLSLGVRINVIVLYDTSAIKIDETSTDHAAVPTTSKAPQQYSPEENEFLRRCHNTCYLDEKFFSCECLPRTVVRTQKARATHGMSTAVSDGLRSPQGQTSVEKPGGPSLMELGPLPSPAEFATGTLEDKLERLDGLIRGLGQFIQGKSNLHKEVISYQVSLGMALSALRRTLESQVPPRPPAADKAVCTSPLFTGSATSKRLATSPLASHATPKRHAVTPASKQHDENNNEVGDQDGFVLVDRRRHRQRKQTAAHLELSTPGNSQSHGQCSVELITDQTAEARPRADRLGELPHPCSRGGCALLPLLLETLVTWPLAARVPTARSSATDAAKRATKQRTAKANHRAFSAENEELTTIVTRPQARAALWPGRSPRTADDENPPAQPQSLQGCPGPALRHHQQAAHRRGHLVPAIQEPCSTQHMARRCRRPSSYLGAWRNSGAGAPSASTSLLRRLDQNE
ncbi:unnamed protein product [Trichogramma brassicae]|uniref:Uncharacterized protein n=1 Tax=Trichogramma brassicae TaxID=86971 RepID=A0A6H5J4U1_9HYME|nr:unnamed protein product [Trichogramma brassicae]